MAPVPYFGEEKARLDIMRNTIRGIVSIGRGLWSENLPIEHFAEGYAQWYVYLESAIVEMLKGLGYTIDAGDTGKGGHRYHEAVLELLQDTTNPFHVFLGESEVHKFLKSAKRFRNI
ncbi:hypothetical protein N7G274_007357 [Stereocaulon virgatum]|uniref:Uncharacterized protein n=1 Tax=Stereocaulon virgatum TaxID=373712 RepID=A0ABR4A368_9LECA